MPEVVQLAASDVLARMPEAVVWNETLLEAADVLICCAGFEDRATAFVKDLHHAKVARLIVVRYPTNEADNEVGAARLASTCAAGRVELRYRRDSFYTDLKRELSATGTESAPRIVVDVSGMASYLIYSVFAAIFEVLPQGILSVYYAEAAEYSPTRTEWEAFYSSLDDPGDNLAVAERYEETHFQSRGVEETYESDVFPGKNIGPVATLFIAVPSFSLQRMKSMAAYASLHYNTSPTDIKWYLGQPPDKIKNGWRYDAMAALYNVRSDGVAVSTRDYLDILRRLDELWEDKHVERHLIIGNLGSKMQHVGTALFLLMHPECALILCEPNEFIADQYSIGIGPRWWLDFGAVNDLKRLLLSRGDLDFRW